MSKNKWHFNTLNRDLVKREENILIEQKNCEHQVWKAKCSCCGKILASDTQDTTDIKIKEIIENNLINILQ